jgi:hypothetical protein
MFNPFIILTRPLLSKLITRGLRYFVRQTYRRGEVAGVAPGNAFLISGYADLEQAETHFARLGHDRHRAIYDVKEPGQFRLLQTAAIGVPGFAVYSNLRKGDWKPTLDYRRKISGFVRSMGWPATTDGLSAELAERYGELFVRLQCGDQETEVLLSQFET